MPHWGWIIVYIVMAVVCAGVFKTLSEKTRMFSGLADDAYGAGLVGSIWPIVLPCVLFVGLYKGVKYLSSIMVDSINRKIEQIKIVKQNKTDI